MINISFSYKWEEGLWYLQYSSRKQITRNKIRKGQWLSENDNGGANVGVGIPVLRYIHNSLRTFALREWREMRSGAFLCRECKHKGEKMQLCAYIIWRLYSQFTHSEKLYLGCLFVTPTKGQMLLFKPAFQNKMEPPFWNQGSFQPRMMFSSY